MAKLTITVTDPNTIELLVRYKSFLKAEDGATGSINELVEGLIVGSLDGHDRFADWRRRGTQPSAMPKLNNVTRLHVGQVQAPPQRSRRSA